MRQHGKAIGGGAPSFLAVGSVLLAATIGGAASGPLIRAIYNGGMSMDWIILLRVVAVMILTWPPVLINKKLRHDMFSVGKSDLLKTILAAALISGNFLFWAYSLEKESVFGSSSISTVQYLFSVIFGYLILKEKPGKGVVVSVLLTFSGIAVIGWSDFKTVGDISGSIFAIAAAICGALYFVISRSVRKNLSINTYFTWLNTFGTAMVLVVVMIIGIPLEHFNLSNTGLIIALAIFCSLGGHYLIAWSLKYVTADVPNLFGFSSPLFAAVMAYIFIGQTVKPQVFAGAVLILAGIGFYIYMQQREKKKHRVCETPVIEGISK